MINLGLFTASFGSFIWGIGRFFRVHGHKPAGTHVIQVVGGAMMLWHALQLWRVAGAPAPPLSQVGSGLYALSLAVFWSAVLTHGRRPPTLAFSDDAPDRLVESGPYRHVRHPFYLSYSLAWLAGVAATRQPWLLVSVTVMGAIYVSAARREERKFLAGQLAASYRDYQRRTGMFVPQVRTRLPSR
jgi:protein-S-isoprenylcysteine O-methyltransferase Ste14